MHVLIPEMLLPKHISFTCLKSGHLTRSLDICKTDDSAENSWPVKATRAQLLPHSAATFLTASRAWHSGQVNISLQKLLGFLVVPSISWLCLISDVAFMSPLQWRRGKCTTLQRSCVTTTSCAQAWFVLRLGIFFQETKVKATHVGPQGLLSPHSWSFSKMALNWFPLQGNTLLTLICLG